MSDFTADPSEYKVYWFSRAVIANKFGNYAQKEPETLHELASELESELEREGITPADCEETIETSILGSITRIYGGDISRRYRQAEDLCERIQRRIDTLEDVESFILAIETVARTTEILDKTPRFGEEEVVEIVDETLADSQGETHPDRAYDALYNVDFRGEEFQLGAQREPLIEYVSELMTDFREQDSTDNEIARIVSGITQEYERRAGQSRASTAGNVLEMGLQHIFEEFNIPATGTPEHFGDIEIDNIVEGPDGSIGFSCKRTQRERFRQSLSRQAEIGVDEIWFVSLMMADVSRDKIVDISNDGGRIYVPRDSFVWERYSEDEEISYALRPADQFIGDIKEYLGI